MEVLELYKIAARIGAFHTEAQLQSRLNELVQTYNALTSNADNVKQIRNASRLRDDIAKVLSSPGADLGFSPIDYQYILKLELTDILPQNLAEEIDGILSRPKVVPSSARSELEYVNTRLRDKLNKLNVIRSGLDALGLNDRGGIEEYEISVYIPFDVDFLSTSAISESIGQFEKVLLLASEMATGKHEPIEVRRISSGSLFLEVVVARLTLGLFMKAYEWCLKQREQALSNAMLKEQLREKKISNDLLEKLDKEIDGKLLADEKFVHEVIEARVSESIEASRRNELISGAGLIRKYIDENIKGGGNFGFNVPSASTDEISEQHKDDDHMSDEALRQLNRTIFDQLNDLRNARQAFERRDALQVTNKHITEPTSDA